MKFEKYRQYYSEDCDGVLISLKEIAEQHGLNEITLMSRLELGCPLVIAVQMPEEWDILGMGIDGDGELSFGIAKKTYQYRGKELLHYLAR